MKILFTIGGFGRGGKERRLMSLIDYLSGLDVELGLIAAANSPNLPEVAPYCAKVYEYVRGDAFFNLREHRRAVREFAPDIIHSWNGTNTIYSILGGAGHRFRLITSEITNAKTMPLLSLEFARTRIAFALADLVLSNSFAGLRAKRAPAWKSSVIYNGYRMDRLDSIDAKKYALLRRPGMLHVAMCARFSKEKDFTTVLAVAEMAHRKGSRIRFFLAGEGPDLVRLQGMARERKLENIEFLGYVSDMDHFLHQMDVGILATDPRFHQEGVPNSVMEAMAHGMPVVATDGGALREIVTDGFNGYLVEPRSPAALLARLTALEADRNSLERLGSNARRTVTEKFDLGTMGARVLSVYQTALGGPPGPGNCNLCDTDLSYERNSSPPIAH